MFSSTKSGGFNASSFQVIKDSMLQSDRLPLSGFVDDDRWEAVLEQHTMSTLATTMARSTPLPLRCGV